jgi:N12 class adenine-specific DNA methylase
MKISELNISHLKNYANVYHVEDDVLFDNILIACKSYIKGYTGLSDESLDLHEDLTVALMVLANELYDNRAYNIESSKANLVIQSILNMYSINLL